MKLQPVALNNGFGAVVNGVTPENLEDPAFQADAKAIWVDYRGLLAVRGERLRDLQPEQLVAWSEVFGRVERDGLSAREWSMVEGQPILRIGNITDEEGNPKSRFALVEPLISDADVRYNPATRRPVWHTDSTFKSNPPIGSVFHCKQAPPSGGDTLFADTRGAFAALDDATKRRLEPLEAVCSLAHHDKKISLYSPNIPALDAEQRAANPPNRVPIVLEHPLSGEPALYGLNSSTCALVQKGQAVSDEAMDAYDLEGIEDESVLTLRELLPFVTGPEFTVRWQWQPGDVVVWDNRCTLHAATGFDHDSHKREMWRLTLLD